MSTDAFLADLSAQADALDRGLGDSDALLPALAAAGLPHAGVPQAWGGAGGDVRDAVQAIAAVAERSLTAAFMLWGHRTCIEYLLASPNTVLAERWLPELLDGRTAGATGLSNAMKFLAGIESLQVHAEVDGDGGVDATTWTLDGALPWVTNLRPAGFVAAAAVARRDGGAPAVVLLDSRAEGVQRSADLDLLALRGSHTAAIRVQAHRVSPRDGVITDDATRWLPAVRPAFLGMQCGMSIGLARAALRAAGQRAGSSRPVLAEPLDQARRELDGATDELLAGLADRRYEARAAELFRLRIRLAEIVQRAASLELQASGGAAYLVDRDRSFGRRWAEAAFIPVITPSLTQLQAQLQTQAQPQARPASPVGT